MDLEKANRTTEVPSGEVGVSAGVSEAVAGQESPASARLQIQQKQRRAPQFLPLEYLGLSSNGRNFMDE
jgi:hypothetical protein